MAGSYKLLNDLCEMAQIKRPEHAGHGTPFTVGEDGKFSIEFVECLASCGTAPVCMVNDDFYENVNKEAAAQILPSTQLNSHGFADQTTPPPRAADDLQERGSSRLEDRTSTRTSATAVTRN